MSVEPSGAGYRASTFGHFVVSDRSAVYALSALDQHFGPFASFV